MVGVAGFEPTPFRSQSARATKLRHTPSVRHVGYMAADAPAARYSTDGQGCAGKAPDPLRCFPCRGPGDRTRATRGACGRSSMVEPQSSKLATRVRFPSPAPRTHDGPAPGIPRGRAVGVSQSFTSLMELATESRKSWMFGAR